jgi:hypothetical protein
MLGDPEFNAESQSSTAVLKADPAAALAAIRLVLRVVLVDFRTREGPVNSPADLVPSIPLVPALPAPAQQVPAVLEAPVVVPVSVHAQASADLAPGDLVRLLVGLQLQARLRGRRDPRGRRAAVAVSSTPRPKKAR